MIKSRDKGRRLARRVAGLVLGGSAVLVAGIGWPRVGWAQPEPVVAVEVDSLASEFDVPGMAIRILDSDSVVEEAESGRDGGGEPIGSDTPFVWGSVSKQFAAAVVLSLERKGLIRRETPVVDVLPAAREILADLDATIDDLVHHTSGLPHDVSVTDDWTRRGSATEALDSIGQPDGAAQRGTFRYSSLNYLLLQAVVEEVTGGSYTDALRANVLDPAGTDAITDPDEFTATVPPGYAPFFGSPRSVDVGVDSAGLGYGYLAGSVDELGRYAQWRLAELQDGESTLPTVPTTGDAAYGDGLFVEDVNGQRVWWHAGAVPGYYTFVALVPDSDRALVVLANRYGEIEADRLAAIGRNLMTEMVGGEAVDPPESSAPAVLAVLFGATGVLIAATTWPAFRLFSGRSRRISRRGVTVPVLAAAVIGGALLLGAVVVVPSIVGASLPVMWLWAPDVTLAFWILLGTVFLSTAVIIAGEIASYRSRSL